MNLRILIVEPNPEDLLFLTDVLIEIEAGRHWGPWVQLEALTATNWPGAAAILAKGHVDLILLSFSTEEGDAFTAFRDLQIRAPQIPVILITDSDQIENASRLVREGVQDVVPRHQIDCAPLAHAMRTALERHRLLSSARSASMNDSLTGVANRAGFLAWADRDRRLAERLQCRLLIMIAEPKNLAGLTETYGDQRRDLTLVETADHLRGLLSPTDLLGRLGEGSFGIAIFETDIETVDAAWARIQAAAHQHRLHLGGAIFEWQHPEPLETLLDQARLDLPTAAFAMRR